MFAHRTRRHPCHGVTIGTLSGSEKPQVCRHHQRSDREAVIVINTTIVPTPRSGRAVRPGAPATATMTKTCRSPSWDKHLKAVQHYTPPMYVPIGIEFAFLTSCFVWHLFLFICRSATRAIRIRPCRRNRLAKIAIVAIRRWATTSATNGTSASPQRLNPPTIATWWTTIILTAPTGDLWISGRRRFPAPC